MRHKSTRDWLPALVALVGLVGIAAMFSISSRARPEEAEDVGRRPEPEQRPTPPADAASDVVDAGPVAGETEPRAPPARLRLALVSVVFAWRTLRYSNRQRYVVFRRALSYLLLALVAIVLAIAIVSALD